MVDPACAPVPDDKALRLVGQRARSAQDKDLRRSHLVQAAAELFALNDFDGVTIANVARRAGVAKGTAYLYFNSKEAVFLELVQSELLDWEQDLQIHLEPLPTQAGGNTTNEFAATVARTLAHRPTLCRLLVLLHSVIEPRLDLQTARQFKEFLRDLMVRVGSLFVAHVPELELDGAVTLILQMHALVISVTQLAHPPPVVATVLEHDPSLHPMRIAFEPFMAQTLATLLHGMLAAQNQDGTK
jgi:AcrR family transcriptional regulator